MFGKLSTLLLLVPAIAALQLNPPTTQVYSSSPITVTWSTSTGDPNTFDLYLTNPEFHNTFALKNTINTSDGNVTVTIPAVQPGSGYTFQASPTGNVNSVLSQTSTFDIDQALSSSSNSSSSTSSGTGTLSSFTTTGSGSTIATSGTSTGTSPGSTSTGSFNGNGALGVTGIGATVVGVLVAAGAFFGL